MTSPTIRELMSTDLKVVSTSMSVEDLASFLVEEGISGAPVESEDGELVGVVSMTDIAGAASQASAEVEEAHSFYRRGDDDRPTREALADARRSDLSHLTVEDVMTPSILAVEASAPASQAASAMVSGHLHRLLVVDGRRVVGILTAIDLLRLLY